jgi:hypothetical protein
MQQNKWVIDESDETTPTAPQKSQLPQKRKPRNWPILEYGGMLEWEKTPPELTT